MNYDTDIQTSHGLPRARAIVIQVEVSYVNVTRNIRVRYKARRVVCIEEMLLMISDLLTTFAHVDIGISLASATQAIQTPQGDDQVI